ncbi:Bifunctional riboflavin kinase/FMN adenylyltransferase [Candidatus Erwinia haradaeae]|uniref:Riboflavin biosynthesis protein n=1 Tax=Candidatus Erwinia haradaeae TaxID=1922217 RepID=A0A451DJD4_9GAMM|nr:bifunctional riboflavin kinase/FAD synthetase [Candidatus Erwinia haradaeae]VFP86812.1 Bifunctional riboflavin kinase/FMN adenylyltransferase [Candidatus Erwinia haradaeae]
MRLIRGIHNLRAGDRGCALTIGNFDGVHRGHQSLLAQLCKKGRQRNTPIMVMLFEPHPLERFSLESAPPRLTRLHEKLCYLKNAGVHSVLCARFSRHFALQSAQNFITDLLINRLGVTLLAIGDDFRFGSGRSGDFFLLQHAAIRYGFEILGAKTLLDNKKRISSTAIRQALATNNLPLATTLLGRPFSICGRVVRGDSIGHMLGFPTANVPLLRTATPITGVYIVYVKQLDNQVLHGVANIGMRPTLARSHKQLEVHVLDRFIDLYGQYIEVIFLYKIRDEKRFNSLAALKEQIQDDVIVARNFFDQNSVN